MSLRHGCGFKRCAALALLGWCGLSAQNTSQKFEVAAIRPDKSGSQGETVDRHDGGRYSVTNASLQTLILNAYNVLPFQIAGGPRWLDADRLYGYNIHLYPAR